MVWKPTPLQKFFGLLGLVICVAIGLGTLILAIWEPSLFRSGRGGSLLDTRVGAILFLLIFGGLLVGTILWVRRVSRRMEKLGLDPEKDSERYLQAYLGQFLRKDK